MSVADYVDELIERYQLGLDDFMKGNPEPVKELFSHREDVTLANPLGPPAHGWDEVSATIERAASQFRDGRLVGVEIVEKQATPEFAYTLWLEHVEGKVGAREDIAPSTLRVTMIYRPRRAPGRSCIDTRTLKSPSSPQSRLYRSSSTLERTSQNSVKKLSEKGY